MAEKKRSSKKANATSSDESPKPEVVFTRLPVAVIGDGWAATALVAQLAATDHDILWIAGTGARAASPISSLESGAGAEFFHRALLRLGIEEDPVEVGHFMREFRNKSFARPGWMKAPTREARGEAIQEFLWAPEVRFAPLFEARFMTPLFELEEKFRAKLQELPRIRKISGVPVQGFVPGENPQVILGSGETFPVGHVYFADRWSSLIGMEGLPKGSPLTRNREPMGILQAVFSHHTALASTDMHQNFFGLAHKDPGEEITRNVFGYFFGEGKRSVWSIFVAPEESEDNHAIARKLRRLKQALDRMFVGPDWLPEGTKCFLDTVKDEQMRFEESFVLSHGPVPTEAVKIPNVDFISFFTDGFGPSVAYEHVASAFGEILIPSTSPETEAAPSV